MTDYRHYPEYPHLQPYKRDAYSQYGEDGILDEIVKRLALNSWDWSRAWLVDVGAWDGVRYSNTYHLINKYELPFLGIEAHEARFAALRQTCQDGPTDMIAVQAMATPETLPAIIAEHLPRQGELLLNLDTDGGEEALWRSVGPRFPIVIAEWCDHGKSHEATLLATAAELDYAPIAKTNANLIFIWQNMLAPLGIHTVNSPRP